MQMAAGDPNHRYFSTRSADPVTLREGVGERPIIQVQEGAEPSGSVPGDAGRPDVERPSRERSEPRAASFTDRLLEAKRRAQRDLERRDQD